MNRLKIFENVEFGTIRTVIIDGEPWFVGKDVAGALEYKDEFGALKKHVLSEDKLLCQIDSAGQKREVTVINESGLYALIFGSKLDSAKKFKHWVTGEVLPSIRKTGTYAINLPISDRPGEVARLINATARLMERQGTVPYKVAENAQLICNQYGIRLIDDFVKIPEYEQMSLFASDSDAEGR